MAITLPEITFIQQVITLVLSVAAVISIGLGILRWKFQQIIKSAEFTQATGNNFVDLNKRIDDLCNRLAELKEKMNNESMSKKAEQVQRQIHDIDIVKKLSKMETQLDILIEEHKNKHNNQDKRPV